MVEVGGAESCSIRKDGIGGDHDNNNYESLYAGRKLGVLEVKMNLWDLAENVSHSTLADFLHLLRTRPEPHALVNTVAYLSEVARTLRLTPWDIFINYAADGPVLPELAEAMWKTAFPDLWRTRRKPQPQTGIVLQFPMDRVRKAGAI